MINIKITAANIYEMLPTGQEPHLALYTYIISLMSHNYACYYPDFRNEETNRAQSLTVTVISAH